MRQRGGSTSRRDHNDAATSAREIGGQLREAREERGLDLLTVHDRLDRPITQLEALEQGDLAVLADQARALSTLRRYAAFLGLDGDALALRMIDAWSTAPETAAVAASAPPTTLVASLSQPPDHLKAFTQTGPVPRFDRGPGARSRTAVHPAVAGPPTGTFPLVSPQAAKSDRKELARARRRLRAPSSLKVLTWLVALLLVAALVGLGIDQWRPRWLVSAHILRVEGPGGAAARQPPSSTGPATTVALTSSNAESATYAVRTGEFTVEIVTSGEVWLEVTSSEATAPLVAGVQPSGKRLSFPAKGTMTVQVGAVAVTVGVSVKGKTVFYNTPHNVPFSYIFSSGPGGSSSSSAS